MSKKSATEKTKHTTRKPAKEKQILAIDLLNQFEKDLNSGLFGSTKEEIMKSLEKKIKK